MSDSTSRFSVTLRGEVIATSDDPFIAAAAYRAAVMRGDLRAEGPEVVLLRDGGVWRSAQAGRVMAEKPDLPEPSANDVLKLLLAGGMTERELINALNAVGLPVSGSQVQGWFAAESNRRYRLLTLAELYAVAKALLWHDNQRAELDAD